MNTIKYDIAFAPINKRLILISDKLGQLLKKNGISSTILKTSIIGYDHNGWGDLSIKDNIKTKVTSIKEINYKTHSNFLSYSYRVMKSRMSMKKSYEPNFKCLILFMDDYGEAEVFVPLMKEKNIPIILFQEGFFVKEKKYEFDLYSFGKYIRSRLLPKFFTAKNYSENSDYIFSWSDRGFKDFLKSINTNESKVKIVGYPFKIQDKKLNKNKPYDKVLILHSPLPSKKAEKFDNIKYIQIIEHLDKLKLNVSFKAHPRIGFKKIHNLINYKKSFGIGQNLTILEHSLSSENLYDNYDIIITTPSASSIEALYRGIPVIFVPNQYNDVLLLENLANKNKVILAKDLNDIPIIISNLNNNIVYRNEVIKSGYEAAKMIGGELDIFDDVFPKEIKKILKSS